MKIVSADVIVCCPGRNFVTLKITTDEGVTGLGDATLNGRELAVASYLKEGKPQMFMEMKLAAKVGTGEARKDGAARNLFWRIRISETRPGKWRRVAPEFTTVGMRRCAAFPTYTLRVCRRFFTLPPDAKAPAWDSPSCAKSRNGMATT